MTRYIVSPFWDAMIIAFVLGLLTAVGLFYIIILVTPLRFEGVVILNFLTWWFALTAIYLETINAAHRTGWNI